MKVFLGAVVAAMLAAAGTLVAQADDAREVPDLNGSWQGGGVRYPCTGLYDTDGRERVDCSIPVAQLKLTARAMAWQTFADEPISPKFDCVAESLPTLTNSGPLFRLKQFSDRVVIEYEKDDVVRTVWLDRKHPPATEVFWMGHSIGRYEANELVVETTNFTFDPDGIDNMGHIPSSSRKKLIERFSRLAPDRLRYTYTVEDPLFLKQPFTGTLEPRRSNREPERWDCDPETGRLPLRLLPQKYPD